MKSIFKNLFFLSFTLFVFTYGQSQVSVPTNERVPSLSKSYSTQELDSFAPILRQYYYDGDYERVLELVPRLITHADSSDMFLQAFKLRNILGTTFSTIDEPEKAFEIFNQGLNKAQKRKDTLALLNSYINLGNIFLKEDPPKAIDYFENALKFAKESISYERQHFIIENNLAELFLGVDDLTEAQSHLDSAYQMLEDGGLKESRKEYLAVVKHNQGAIYLEQKKYKAAITTIREAFKLGKNAVEENYLLRSYRNLMSAHEKLEQYKSVNAVRHTYDSLITRRYEAQKIKQQNIATTKYSLDSYKQQLRQSQLENELTVQEQERSNLKLRVFYFSFVVLLGILGILFYGRYKRKLLMKDLRLKNQQYLHAKEQSEKLANKNNQFLSTISHELRTPLYGIIGLSSVFLKNKKFKEYSEDLNSLKFSADYLLALVNDVLNLNKFSSIAGKKINKSYFKIGLLIRSITQNVEFLNRKNNNKVFITIGQDVPQILLTDKTKISQILINLISNASKFTEDGTIEIIVNALKKKKNKHYLQFIIKDTGKGIPKEEQANIFNEFTQVENNIEIIGTGLGLPIVNNILKTLDSKLVLESVLNKGSQFSFELWLESGRPEDIKEEVKIGKDKLKGKRILIVDDNKINQVVTQKVLEQYKMIHTTASNGQEAVSLAKDQHFDAILMDINMPVMNGMEASKRIRFFNKNIPIIALTAINYSTEDNELSAYGINNYIVKPYETDDLREMLLKNIVQL
jgi:signal transduction histidine kinase